MTKQHFGASILAKSAGMARSCALLSCTLSSGVFLSGCTVTSPAQLHSSTGAARPLSQITLIAPDEKQVQRTRLYDAVTSALQSKGVTLDPEAATIAELAIASSPSTVGLYASEAGVPDDNARPIAATREPRWYDACKASRVKATIAVFDRATGDLVKRAEAHGITCEGDDLPVAELAGILADDLVAK